VIRKAFEGCVRDGLPFDVEAVLITAKGNRLWVHAMGEAARGSDSSVAIVHGAFQDITERKQVEEKLRLSLLEQQRLASAQVSILNALPAHVALVDQHGVIISVNEGWRKFAGTNALQDADSGVGRNYLEICEQAAGPYAEEAHRVAAGIRSVLSGTRGRFEIEYPCNSITEKKWFLLLATPLRETSVSGAVVMHVDISAQKSAEESKRESEERFRSVFAAAAIGIAISKPHGPFIQANEAYCKMLGYSERELQARSFETLTHPDDLGHNIVLRNELLCGKRQSFSMEKRYIQKGGGIVWTRHSVSATHSAEGEITSMIVVAEDITERKKSEEALRASEKRFKALFEQAAVGVAQVDAITRQYLQVNHRFCEILGRSRESLLQITAAATTHTEDFDRTEGLFRQMNAGTVREFCMEKRYVRPDGSVVWASTTCSAMWVPGEPPDHFIVVVQDITERKRAESRYRRLFDSDVHGVMFWNTRGDVTEGNDYFLRLTRYSRDDLRAGLVNWARMTPPEYTHLDQRALAEIAAKGACETYEKEWICKDGTRIPILIGAAMLEGSTDEGVCFVLNLTERMKADEALRASEIRFKTLFEQAAVGVAQVDVGTGRFSQINRRFCEIFGRGREELSEMPATEITHPKTSERRFDSARLLSVDSMREFTVERRYARKDGSEVWAQVTVSEMWAPGQAPDYYMVIVQDITSRKKLEDQFREAQKMEAMGTLAGGIAHDFNNILSSINGYTELAQIRLVGNPEVREYLGSVLQAGHRAADLVRQILAFSRRETVERAPIQLRPVVAESVKLLRATIPSTIEFVTSLATDAPTVLADATQINQVMMNLGTNAWHAMKDTSGKIEFSLERCVVDEIHAAAHPRLRPGLYARVSVRDSGCGMDQATVQRIFEPFFTTKPQGEGTGLGLSVVHGIMENHDGSVAVYSQPSEGTVFRLYFPAHTGEEIDANSEEAPTPRGNGERILFVDDEELLVRLGRAALSGLGYTVESTAKPEEALELVRANPERFELVLTDHTMPGMTGLLLAARIRQIRPDLPIVLMTGYSGVLMPERMEEAGIRQLLLKPTNLHSLGLAVRQALSGETPK
jgi:PAS domain S-box-containing protein